ncbi:triacylglycerol [Apiospora rasikravindrae]|uniref:Carboxylic ester hydrolase n=1 Tax=Apiospora rasikravindrae TaxID=990691 RepID=A0ABR1SI64_9PEZI
MLSRHLPLFFAGLAAAVEPLVDLKYTKVQGAALANGATQWLGVRYAAAPVGDMRFAAPIDPPAEAPGTVVDATQFRPICLPRSASDFTMKPNKRFTVSEDCLYLNIFAPSNATADTNKRPVIYFIQGGGFQSNSNANFNGSDLAVFGDIVVVQINYRVGPFGFAQSKEVQAGGSLNNGLKDMIQGLKWVKQNVAMFGGDPDQVVVAGDSAGATGVAMLLAAFADKDPGLFRGAIMESASVATVRTLEQGQEQYDCLANATGCLDVADSLTCLRGLNASALQTEQCQFNPHLDGDLIKTPMLDSFKNGKFLKVPTLAGACSDEGTKNVPQDTDTMAAARSYINDQASGALSNSSLDLIEKVYLDAPQPVFAGAGKLWRQLANAHGDFRSTCITAALANGQAAAGVQTYNYRYAVRDPEQDALGFGAYHTVELNGVFGPDNTDGAPPKSYCTSNAAIVPITMAYWASFIKTLDPNAARAAGTPEWKPWTVEGRERLRFETETMGMETMNDTQKANCDMFGPMLPAIETPLDKPGSVVLTRN